MKLSIVIPVYNEEKTLLEILKRIEKVNINDIEKEIILIDDFSTDNTKQILKKLENKYKVFYHKKNQGKGAALRTGFKNATGDFIIIQDADLEYNPQEYTKMLELLIKNKADIIYGSRNLKKNPRSKKTYYWGVLFLAFLNNILFKSKLTDTYTCYKMFKKDVLNDLSTKSNGFEWEAEITAKALKKGYKIKEIPIDYSPRSFKQGKKINWKDGIKGVYTIIKYRFKS